MLVKVLYKNVVQNVDENNDSDPRCAFAEMFEKYDRYFCIRNIENCQSGIKDFRMRAKMNTIILERTLCVVCIVTRVRY